MEQIIVETTYDNLGRIAKVTESRYGNDDPKPSDATATSGYLITVDGRFGQTDRAAISRAISSIDALRGQRITIK